MARDELVDLCCGALEVVLAPAKGGAILSFDCVDDNRRLPILRGGAAPLDSVLDAGCFPLVPFCNRLRGGRFTFRGREVELKANMRNDSSPLHGQGWLASWTIAAADETSAELVYRHAAGEWPWAYEARQHFALDASGLSVMLECTNLADEAMPCGLGQHPYFNCTAQTRLDTRVSHAWTIDHKVLPVDKVPATGRYDLADRPICGQTLDNGFTGWNGIARITDSAMPFTVEISSPDAGYFQVYSPVAGRIFAAEPVSHANAAMNEPEEAWPALGFRVLEPGQTMTLSTRIAISPVGGSASPAS